MGACALFCWCCTVSAHLVVQACRIGLVCGLVLTSHYSVLLTLLAYLAVQAVELAADLQLILGSMLHMR